MPKESDVGKPMTPPREAVAATPPSDADAGILRPDEELDVTLLDLAA